MEKQKRAYNREFKIKVVELGNHRWPLNWVFLPRTSAGGGRNMAQGKLDENMKPIVTKSAEQLENIALRKALRDAELERDILKKALGIFSKSDR